MDVQTSLAALALLDRELQGFFYELLSGCFVPGVFCDDLLDNFVERFLHYLLFSKSGAAGVAASRMCFTIAPTKIADKNKIIKICSRRVSRNTGPIYESHLFCHPWDCSRRFWPSVSSETSRLRPGNRPVLEGPA